jgi:hypothetical protein
MNASYVYLIEIAEDYGLLQLLRAYRHACRLMFQRVGFYKQAFIILLNIDFGIIT